MKYMIFSILLLASLLCGQESGLPLIYHETFENGAKNWQPNDPDHWQVVDKDGAMVYELTQKGESGRIRKPTSISILAPYEVGSFSLEVTAMCYTTPLNPYRDLCLLFGYQDSVHFYYAHFSGRSDQAHNAIHIVNNADREKINVEPAGESKALLKDKSWYKLKITRDAESGAVEAFVNDEKILTANDKTFVSGKIGIGSFDDTGAFKEVILRGELVK